jgi:pyridinium-3,5-biscarboxylic acid mononucleotide sulfurtransferase
VTQPLSRLLGGLDGVPKRVIACSGGIDSLLLATIAHRNAPTDTVIAHAVTPAVPAAATARVLHHADVEGWTLNVVRSTEFDDPRYLSNPRNRCYFCKSHLYDALAELSDQLDGPAGWTVLSGANIDDLGEYRPGLQAAEERGVRHPYIDAGIDKASIRAIARLVGSDYAELPASPCLASRLYTGTEVTPGRLRAVEVGEEVLRQLTGIGVARCRLREDLVIVEVGAADRALVTGSVLDKVTAAMVAIEPGLLPAELDEQAYRPGRALEIVT